MHYVVGVTECNTFQQHHHVTFDLNNVQKRTISSRSKRICVSKTYLAHCETIFSTDKQVVRKIQLHDQNIRTD